MSAASGSSDISKNIGAVSSNGMKSDYGVASSMKLDKSIAAFTPSGNSYLDSLTLKNIEMKNYESFNKTKQFNTQQFLASQNKTEEI
jgi:hypothetical protein